MKKKLAVIFPVIMTLTACAGGYSEREESISETVSEVSESTESISETVSEISESAESISETSEQTEAVSEAFSEDETTSRSTVQTESEAAAVSFTESEKSPWKTLYREKLAAISVSEDYEPSIYGFDIFDVDSDGVPELFVSDGNYHAAGVMIFTVKDDECISLKNTGVSDEFSKDFAFGSWGTVQAAEGGYIASCYSGMGAGYADYFKLENGELSLIVSSEHHLLFPDENGEEKFVIDGNEVSEEDYIEAVGSLAKMKWTFVGQAYHSFDTDEVDKILSQ